jgi:hypothetical protein
LGVILKSCDDDKYRSKADTLIISLILRVRIEATYTKPTTKRAVMAIFCPRRSRSLKTSITGSTKITTSRMK